MRCWVTLPLEAIPAILCKFKLDICTAQMHSSKIIAHMALFLWSLVSRTLLPVVTDRAQHLLLLADLRSYYSDFFPHAFLRIFFTPHDKRRRRRLGGQHLAGGGGLCCSADWAPSCPHPRHNQINNSKIQLDSGIQVGIYLRYKRTPEDPMGPVEHKRLDIKEQMDRKMH